MCERILAQNCQKFDNFIFEFSLSHHNAHYQSYKNAPYIHTYYIGLSKPEWKTRYGNHKTNFKHSAQRVKTTLGYVWELKDQNDDFNIKWTTMAKARAFTPSSKMCRPCLMGKVKIMHTGSTLNKRTEFFSSCRHKEGLLLS